MPIAYNNTQNGLRSIVEAVFSLVKNWRITGTVYKEVQKYKQYAL
jgi:hypothetical protein